MIAQWEVYFFLVEDKRYDMMYEINAQQEYIMSLTVIDRFHPRLRDELRYTQDMGLNTIRLEGKLETKEFFDLADERGILVMAGWCCCDHWEHWPNWKT